MSTNNRPSISPDGTKIAVASNRDGNSEIYVMNVNGSNQKNLTNDSYSGETNPSWSPDGTKIAFDSYFDGIAKVYIMNSDGSNQRRLTFNTSFDFDPAFSPLLDMNSLAKYFVDDIYKMNKIPEKYQLFHNYPNQFNPITTIKFDIPTVSQVRLDIYNILGQKIKTLVNESKIPGAYEVLWDGTNDFHQKVASGIYIYQIRTGKFIKAEKMTLLK